MNKTRYDKLISTTLKEILREQSDEKTDAQEAPAEDKPKKSPKPKGTKKSSQGSTQGVISTVGAFGSGGRAKAFVTQAGARAEKDPEGLMKDLGVTGPSGGEDLSATLEIIRTAVYSNFTMSQAYLGAKIGQERNQKAIQVTMSKLDRKNGVRFLAHTLKAAQNAGFLNLAGGLQFAVGQSSDIAIFPI